MKWSKAHHPLTHWKHSVVPRSCVCKDGLSLQMNCVGEACVDIRALDVVYH